MLVKKTIVIILLAFGLMVMFSSLAAADWWVEIECLDNPGNPQGSNFSITYHEDANDPDIWQSCSMYWETPEGPGPDDVTVTDASTGGFSAGAGWMLGGSGDDGADGCYISMANFGGANPIDGDVICTIDYVGAPGTLIWDENNPGFSCSINGVVKTGAELMDEGHLKFVDCGPWPPLDFCITTLSADSVTENSAELSAEVDPASSAPWDVYFVYGTTQGGPYPYATNPVSVGSSGGFCTFTLPSFWQSVSNLDPDTTYYYEVRGDCDGPCACNMSGSEESFTTLGATTIGQYVAGIGQYDFGGQVNATVDCTSFSGAGTITITVHPDEFYPGTAGDSVKRWFEITSTAVGTFDLTLRYEEGELGSEDEGLLKLWRHTAGGWDSNGPWGTVDIVNDEVTATGITEFSDWIIADEGGPQPPVPEIITIVLVSLGLLGVSGFIWWRRKRRMQAVARVSTGDFEM